MGFKAKGALQTFYTLQGTSVMSAINIYTQKTKLLRGKKGKLEGKKTKGIYVQINIKIKCLIFI